MPRLPRPIKMDSDGLYHLRGQVAGSAGYYPFEVPENADKLLAIICRYTSLFFSQVVELGLIVYFIPIIIGMLRRHPDLFQIGILNLFYGWTIIGWFGALAWAISSKEE